MPRGLETKIDITTVGGRIKYARKQKKISQICLAMRCEMLDQNGVSRIERNIYMPKLRTINKIASVLGVSTEWIINGDVS